MGAPTRAAAYRCFVPHPAMASCRVRALKPLHIHSRDTPSGPTRRWIRGHSTLSFIPGGSRSSARVHVRPPSRETARLPPHPPWLVGHVQKIVFWSASIAVVGCPW